MKSLQHGGASCQVARVKEKSRGHRRRPDGVPREAEYTGRHDGRTLRHLHTGPRPELGARNEQRRKQRVARAAARLSDVPATGKKERGRKESGVSQGVGGSRPSFGTGLVGGGGRFYSAQLVLSLPILQRLRTFYPPAQTFSFVPYRLSECLLPRIWENGGKRGNGHGPGTAGRHADAATSYRAFFWLPRFFLILIRVLKAPVCASMPD